METEIKGSNSPAWEHAYLYKKIKEKNKIGSFIRPKELLRELKMISRVPKTFHYPILKQMEEEGLIKRINHQKYEITIEVEAKDWDEIMAFYDLLWKEFLSKNLTDKFKIKGTSIKDG